MAATLPTGFQKDETTGDLGGRSIGGCQMLGLQASNVLVVTGEGVQDPSRFYVQPREGNSDSVAASIKVFAEAHRLDDGTTAANYRDATMQVDTSKGAMGTGAAVLNVKGQTNYSGWNPEWMIGFADLVSNTSSAIRAWYYDPDGNFYSAVGWIDGLSVTAGDYCHVQNRFYQAAGSGTTGDTVPTHETGSVSDGGVTWTHVETMSTGNFRGVVGLCNQDEAPPTDASDLRLFVSGDMAMYRNTSLYFYEVPTVGDQATSPNASISFDSNARINSTNGTATTQLATTFFAVQFAPIVQTRQTLDDSDLPSLTAKGGHVMINRTGTTDCDGFTDGVIDQVLDVHNVNPVVYKHSNTGSSSERIMMPDGIDLTVPARSNVEFRLVTGYGWIPKGIL